MNHKTRISLIAVRFGPYTGRGVNKKQQRGIIRRGQTWRGEKAFVSVPYCNLVRIDRPAEMGRNVSWA